MALVQSAVGENEQALASLMRGYDERDMCMIHLEVNLQMDFLRNDSRFKTLSRRIGLSR